MHVGTTRYYHHYLWLDVVENREGACMLEQHVIPPLPVASSGEKQRMCMHVETYYPTTHG